jgi:hypothetical protein
VLDTLFTCGFCPTAERACNARKEGRKLNVTSDEAAWQDMLHNGRAIMETDIDAKICDSN